MIWWYVFTIYELWSYQTFQDIYQASKVNWVAIKALKTLFIYDKHIYQRKKYINYGLNTIRDKYLQY